MKNVSSFSCNTPSIQSWFNDVDKSQSYSVPSQTKSVFVEIYNRRYSKNGNHRPIGDTRGTQETESEYGDDCSADI